MESRLVPRSIRVVDAAVYCANRKNLTILPHTVEGACASHTSESV